MPSKTQKQHNLMAMVANNPAKAKELGIPQTVGAEFMKADKGLKFGTGNRPDLQKANKPKTDHGKETLFKKGGVMKHDDIVEDKKLIKKAFGMHDKQLHEKKKTNLSKLKKGGVAKTVTKEMEYDYKTGKKSFAGTTAQRDRHAEKEGKIVAKHAAYDKDMDMMAKGGMARSKAKGMHSVQKRAKEGAEIVKMARGGGIEVRGKTKGKMIKMCGGGMKGKK